MRRADIVLIPGPAPPNKTLQTSFSPRRQAGSSRSDKDHSIFSRTPPAPVAGGVFVFKGFSDIATISTKPFYGYELLLKLNPGAIGPNLKSDER